MGKATTPSEKPAKIEVVGFGTVEMLHPLLINFGNDADILVAASNFSICGPTFQCYELSPWDRDASGYRRGFGTIQVQQLPHDRIMLVIDPQPAFGEYVPETGALFIKFANQLYTRLVQLGFMPLPEPEEKKDNLGFLKNQ